MATSENIVVTGATGQLGRLVVAELRQRAPQAHVIGLVRDPAKGGELAGRGVELRKANYDDPAQVAAALAGADKVLLISGNEVGKRITQHGNVINAARAAGVKLLAYTSILHADTNPMGLAVEHRETEALIRASGVPFALLRNCWYIENYMGGVAVAIQTGAVLGAAREGRISAASRADYAAAAAAVLAADAGNQAGKVYELAGDAAFTMTQLAAEIARQSGKPVVYKDMPEAAYKAALQGAGLPEVIAGMLAKSSAEIAGDTLYDNGRALSRLIGRPTMTLAEAIRKALAA